MDADIRRWFQHIQREISLILYHLLALSIFPHDWMLLLYEIKRCYHKPTCFQDAIFYIINCFKIILQIYLFRWTSWFHWKSVVGPLVHMFVTTKVALSLHWVWKWIVQLPNIKHDMIEFLCINFAFVSKTDYCTHISKQIIINAIKNFTKCKGLSIYTHIVWQNIYQNLKLYGGMLHYIIL